MDTTPGVSDSIGLGRGPRICISNSQAMLIPLVWHLHLKYHCQGWNCDSETRLRPVELQHELVFVCPGPQQDASADSWRDPFPQGWKQEYLQALPANHTHTNVYQTQNPNSINCTSLSPGNPSMSFYLHLRVHTSPISSFVGSKLHFFFLILPSLKSRCLF